MQRRECFERQLRQCQQWQCQQQQLQQREWRGVWILHHTYLFAFDVGVLSHSNRHSTISGDEINS